MIRMTIPSIGDSEAAAVADALRAADPLSGERGEEFENRVADSVGRKFGVACSSGTAALHLSMLALDIGSHDEVVVAAYGSLAAAHAVEFCGGRPVFVDAAPETFTLDPAAADAAVTERTRAIVPAHTFGLSADMKRIVEIARKHGLCVLEDLAGALGANYKGQRVGSFGGIACLDFSPASVITTSAGGMALTDDPELSAKLHSLRGRGMEIADGRQQCVRPGLDCQMTEVQAAIGLAQMEKLQGLVDTRIELAKWYGQRLRGLKGIELPAKPDGLRHVYQSYVVQCGNDVDRDKLMADLRAERVETGFGGYALHMTTFYRDKYGLGSAQFPVAKRLSEKALALPLYPGMGEAAVDQVCSAIERCMKGAAP